MFPSCVETGYSRRWLSTRHPRHVDVPCTFLGRGESDAAGERHSLASVFRRAPAHPRCETSSHVTRR